MDGLAKVMVGEGLRIVEARTDRTANAALHARMREAAQDAVRSSLRL
jgi:2-succinyl-5-enolpyruvyl-6-hydroxy-3-cyclohexene-1-carboxylate synthase